MAQVTVYLPADVLEAARKCADQENRSLSAWVSTLIRDATATEWPESLVKSASSRGWGPRRTRRFAIEGRRRLSLMWLLDTSVCIPLINRCGCWRRISCCGALPPGWRPGATTPLTGARSFRSDGFGTTGSCVPTTPWSTRRADAAYGCPPIPAARRPAKPRPLATA